MASDLSEQERGYNKAMELKNSTVLNMYKISNYQEFVPVVDYLYDEMVNAFRVPVVAAGGVTSLSHLRILQKLGVEGAIIGKALYTGDIDVKQAVDVVNQL